MRLAKGRRCVFGELIPGLLEVLGGKTGVRKLTAKA
jgi:hypothetical protein